MARRLSLLALDELDRQQPRYRWVEQLSELVSSVRDTALGWQDGQAYEYQRVSALPKKLPGNKQPYRAIAIFDLHESLVGWGFASYLRDLVDDRLTEHCFAFRRSPAFDHHAAVRVLRDFQGEFQPHDTIWCTECDIQCFYDSVDHEVATRRVREMCGDCDPRLYTFLASFLQGYDYMTVRTQASEELARQGISDPVLKNPQQALAKADIDTGEEPIGIPQGAFLSCVLANVVLAEADQGCIAALQDAGSRDGRYLRYCDDIFITHRRKGACNEMLDAYLAALRRLQLAHHLPQKVGLYGRHYWKTKSKLPYRWTTTRGPNNVPWIGFVGYQINRDGPIRVRDQSVEKELAKQLRVVDEATTNLERRLRHAKRDGQKVRLPSIQALKYRLLLHLTSFSVGHALPHGWEAQHGRISWARGFPLLADAERDDTSIRRLDRGRRHAIGVYLGNVRRLLNKYGDAVSRPEHGEAADEEIEGDDERPEPFRLRYDGWGMSYQRAVGLRPEGDEPAEDE